MKILGNAFQFLPKQICYDPSQDLLHKFNEVCFYKELTNTVELQWPKHLWSHENMFETGVVQANECSS